MTHEDAVNKIIEYTFNVLEEFEDRGTIHDILVDVADTLQETLKDY